MAGFVLASILSISGITMAAFHNLASTANNIDTWYSVDPLDPYIELSTTNAPDRHYLSQNYTEIPYTKSTSSSQTTLNYYSNDFDYADLRASDADIPPGYLPITNYFITLPVTASGGSGDIDPRNW